MVGVCRWPFTSAGATALTCTPHAKLLGTCWRTVETPSSSGKGKKMQLPFRRVGGVHAMTHPCLTYIMRRADLGWELMIWSSSGPASAGQGQAEMS